MAGWENWIKTWILNLFLPCSAYYWLAEQWIDEKIDKKNSNIFFNLTIFEVFDRFS
jgi:hypothetical protein